MKIVIGLVDNHPSFYKQFSLSLLGVVRYFDTWNIGKGHQLDVISVQDGRVDDMRNTVAAKAIAGGYDYIFFMDTDQTFPVDCLPRLLSYCERDGREAASGLYTYKIPPYLPHIYPKLHDETGKFHIAHDFPLEAPMVIEGAGFGCLLMRTSVFQRLEKPYFTMRFEDGKMVEGEDLPFCKRAKMDMVLDPQVSCGHLKTTTFDITDYLNYNGIEVVEGWVKPTDAQMLKVIDAQSKMMDKK